MSSRCWGIAKLFIFLISIEYRLISMKWSQMTLDNDNVPKQDVDHTRT